MFGSSSTIRILLTLMTSPLSPQNTLIPCSYRPSGDRRPLPHRRIEGQRNRELASHLRSAFHLHVAAMRACDMAHERQSQARAFHVVNQRITATIKLFKNLLLLGLRDADTVILNLKFYAAVGAVQVYADELLVLGIFQRVVH